MHANFNGMMQNNLRAMTHCLSTTHHSYILLNTEIKQDLSIVNVYMCLYGASSVSSSYRNENQ